MNKKKVSIKSLPDNLEFELDIKFINKPEITTDVLSGKDVKIDTNLPSTIVTKFCVLIRTSNFPQINFKLPENPNNYFEGLQSNIKNFIELVCQNKTHVFEIISLYEKLNVKYMAAFIGFLTAFFLREKNEHEIAEFFEISGDVDDAKIAAFKSLSQEIDLV